MLHVKHVECFLSFITPMGKLAKLILYICMLAQCVIEFALNLMWLGSTVFIYVNFVFCVLNKVTLFCTLPYLLTFYANNKHLTV